MYKMVCSLGSETYSSVWEIPKYIRNTLAGKAESVEIVYTGDDKSKIELKKQMSELMFNSMKSAGYNWVITTRKGTLINLFHYIVPGEQDSALSFLRVHGSIIVRRITIEEVLSHLCDKDVIFNEAVNDRSGLRGIAGYDKMVKELQKEIEKVIEEDKYYEYLVDIRENWERTEDFKEQRTW